MDWLHGAFAWALDGAIYLFLSGWVTPLADVHPIQLVGMAFAAAVAAAKVWR